MSDQHYIGFRIEVASRLVPDNLVEVVERFNAASRAKILGLQLKGKIGVDKSNGMIVSTGSVDKKPIKGAAMVNFAVMIPAADKAKVERVVQIINVLGNGRLIKERLKQFADGTSTLNQIPEFTPLKTAVAEMETYMPGITTGAWYYAPEAIFNDQA